MKYLAESLDERNLGQILKWTTLEDDGDSENDGESVGAGSHLALIKEIHHYPEAGYVSIVTSDDYLDFSYGEEVETRMTAELRMARILMNVVTELETGQALEDTSLALSDS